MALPLNQRFGVLAAAQGGTGASANTVNAGDWDAVALFIQIIAGGSTIQIEQSIDGGTTFSGPIFAFVVAGTGGGTVVTTAVSSNILFRIDNPTGIYRTNVTAFVGAATSQYRIAAAYQE